MAGSSARRARRLNAPDEPRKNVEDAQNADSSEEQAVRQPRHRTAARRPTAARHTPEAPRPSAPSRRAAAEVAEETAPAGATRTAGPPSLVARFVGAIDQRRDDPDRPVSSVRMRGRETSVGYVVAAVQVVVPVVFLTVTTGKGASAHPITVAPAIGLVLALAMAASIRLSNRILTAFLAVTSTLATTSVGNAVPLSVRSLSTVDLLAALVFAMWVTLRQSKARNVVLAERRKTNQAARATGPRATGGRAAGARPTGGRRGRKAAEAAEPAGPPPSARYTPPKKRT